MTRSATAPFSPDEARAIARAFLPTHLLGNRYDYFYTLSKLRSDPLYPGVLDALRGTTAPVLDLGCGLGLLLHALRLGGLWGGERGENLLDTGAPFYDVYETSDGGWLAVGPLEQPFYAELLRLLDIEDTALDRLDPRQWPALRALLAATFATRTRDEWTALLEGTDACVEPVLSYAEAPHHPHLSARGTYVEHHGVVQPAPAPRFSRTPGALSMPPPRASGVDTRRALEAWGIADVDALLASGAALEATEAVAAEGS
jgi:alpha-methylacyl-CoA racemase